MKETYNGWKNRQTWNVALWINNDESLYRAAVGFMKDHKTTKKAYTDFIKYVGLDESKTPDGINFISTRLDYVALNSMMRDLID